MAKPVHLFPPTSHTLIEKVQSTDVKQREVAMLRFCRVYHPPIHALARRLGFSVEDAEDLTQDLFLKVIRSDVLQKFERARGTKFSAWLMTLFKNLTAHHRQAQATIKRGGGHEHVDLNTQYAEQTFQSLHHTGLEPALMFDLMLAREIWVHAQDSMRKKHAHTPHSILVMELEPLILLPNWPPPPAQPQSEFARRHGITATQLRTFLCRTLRTQAERLFAAEAEAASPGITVEDIAQLWELLRQHANA
jgi:DNA-directed RNA polymerase specialized sigma24 family protein